MSYGFASWMLTKIAFIIYAVLIMSALFSFYYIENDFFAQQEIIMQAEEVAGMIDSVSSSPYDANASIVLHDVDLILINSTPSFNYIYMEGKGKNYSTVIQASVPETIMYNPKGVSIIMNKTIEVIKWE